MQRTLEAHFDKLVIGANIEGASYAYNRKIPLIFTSHNRPYTAIKTKKNLKLKKYHDLLFMLSMQNLTPFSGMLNNIRLVDHNTLKATTKSNILLTISFNKLIIADDSNIEGLPSPISRTSESVEVYDHFNLIATTLPEQKQFQVNDANLKYFKWYRIFVKKKFQRRIYSKLIIKESEQNNFEFSTHSIYLWFKKILRQYGFNGRWDKTNGFFKPPDVKFIKRDIIPTWKNTYEQFCDNISFLNEEEIVEYPEITKESIIIV